MVALRPECALALGNLAGVLYDQARWSGEGPCLGGAHGTGVKAKRGLLRRAVGGTLHAPPAARLTPHDAPPLPSPPMQGKLEEAIGCYRRAIALQPAFPEAHNNLGNALREAGRLEEAVACYTACIHLQMAAAQAPLLAAGRAGVAGTLAKVCAGQAGPSVGWLMGGTCIPAPSPRAGPHAAPARPPRAAAQGVAAQHAQRLSVAYNNLAGILKLTSRLAECIQCYEHVVYLQVCVGSRAKWPLCLFFVPHPSQCPSRQPGSSHAF